MDFNNAYRLYMQLKEQYEQGQIKVDEFERRVNDMVITDSAGNQWQIGVKTGKWYRLEEQNWVEAIPPGFVQPSTSSKAASPTPATTFQGESSYQDQNQAGKNSWLTGCLIAGLVMLCCLVLVGGGWLAWRSNLIPISGLPFASPTVAPLISQSTAPVIPSVTEMAPPTASPEPLAGPGFASSLVQFQDDFSNLDSGWHTFQDTDGSTQYSSGGFRINVASANYLLWSNPSKTFQNDVSIHVDATKAGGPDDNAFGVICRYQDNDNFYYLFITSDGYAGIARYKNNEKVVLTGKSLIYSDVIKQGAATNNISADCVGNALTLHVNGQKITSVTDSSFSNGDVGLMAKTYDTPGVDILFDNFIVLKAGN